MKTKKKLKHELNFWTNIWKKSIEEIGYFNKDTLNLLEENNLEVPEDGYKKEAFAQKFRMEKEFELEKNSFKNMNVLEIGPGAVQFLEICDSKVSMGIDPLSSRFKELGMINNMSKDTIYLNQNAETLPLMDSYFDIVLSRNCLDHTNNPQKIVQEMSRVLKKSGLFLLSTDINHEPTTTEPLILKKEEILNWIRDANIKTLLIKTDNMTYNFKKGRRIIIKGIKNG